MKSFAPGPAQWSTDFHHKVTKTQRTHKDGIFVPKKLHKKQVLEGKYDEHGGSMDMAEAACPVQKMETAETS